MQIWILRYQIKYFHLYLRYVRLPIFYINNIKKFIYLFEEINHRLAGINLPWWMFFSFLFFGGAECNVDLVLSYDSFVLSGGTAVLPFFRHMVKAVWACRDPQGFENVSWKSGSNHGMAPGNGCRKCCLRFHSRWTCSALIGGLAGRGLWSCSPSKCCLVWTFHRRHQFT